MSSRNVFTNLIAVIGLTAAAGFLTGCACQSPVRPTGRLSQLSPELESLSDAQIETYLSAHARPAFPATIAVAKVENSGWKEQPVVSVLRGTEADGWRTLAEAEDGQPGPVEQVQLVGPLMAGGKATIKNLRDAAAMLHANVLVLYVQDDDSQSGYNPAAMAYWTIVGLFMVPGNTVGNYSACQAVLIDTRSGAILATVEGECKREENVLPGAVDIAESRVREQSRAAAVRDLQDAVRGTLAELASRG